MPIIRTLTAVAFFALVACPVIAHHAAEGIVDEEIYAMIDAMVADTPHADLVFDDMGGGMTADRHHHPRAGPRTDGCRRAAGCGRHARR